jgi:hypothetical protein
MSMRILLLLASLAGVGSPVYALDIKGLEVGKPADCRLLNAPGGQAENSAGELAACPAPRMYWRTTLLAEPVVILVDSDPGTLVIQRLETHQVHFEELLPALAKKFGSPKCVDTNMTNSFGAHSVRTLCTWKDARGTLVLGRNVNELGDTQLTLVSHREVEEAAKARKKASADL